MHKYIDVDKLLVDENLHTLPLGNGRASGRVVVFMEDIENAPTADVQEVVHGKWIDASKKSQVGKKCSICGARIKYSEYFNGNHLYCHKCGARMDGGGCR